jgi:phosphoribosylamine--glycine ligase
LERQAQVNILVIGSGGREHALAWKLAQSRNAGDIFVAPGNPGTARCAQNVDISPSDVKELLKFARKNSIDLTVVGPEAPLVAGMADIFRREELRVFGPTAAGAQLEGSKAFAKELMRAHSIPSARYERFNAYNSALEHARNAELPFVVKADGLAAGKGVTVCRTREEAIEAVDNAMKERIFGEAGDSVIIEDCLVGEEASMICLTDGRTIAALETSQDHKPAFDGDTGPNTGGMGAYSPAPIVTRQVYDLVEREVMLPTIHALKARGIGYRGALYFGLMLCEGEPSVLEYNVRFGDPETQPLMARLKSDLLELMMLTVEGKLDEAAIEWDRRAAVCIVLASGGYPGKYEKGREITGLEEAEKDKDVVVFHAGTGLADGRLVTAGGRVLGVTALGADIAGARDKAYEAAGKIHFAGMHYRKDIAHKALGKA